MLSRFVLIGIKILFVGCARGRTDSQVKDDDDGSSQLSFARKAFALGSVKESNYFLQMFGTSSSSGKDAIWNLYKQIGTNVGTWQESWKAIIDKSNSIDVANFANAEGAIEILFLEQEQLLERSRQLLTQAIKKTAELNRGRRKIKEVSFDAGPYDRAIRAIWTAMDNSEKLLGESQSKYTVILASHENRAREFANILRLKLRKRAIEGQIAELDKVLAGIDDFFAYESLIKRFWPELSDAIRLLDIQLNAERVGAAMNTYELIEDQCRRYKPIVAGTTISATRKVKAEKKLSRLCETGTELIAPILSSTNQEIAEFMLSDFRNRMSTIAQTCNQTSSAMNCSAFAYMGKINDIEILSMDRKTLYQLEYALDAVESNRSISEKN